MTHFKNKYHTQGATMVNTTLVNTTLVTTTLVTTTLPRSKSSKNKDHILSIIKSFSGQANIVAFPRLFVEITGDLCLAAMLSQLIYWSDRATRKDGFVYKSSKDWAEELGVTDYTVRQFKKLPYIETKIIKANGTPTTHYRVQMEALIDVVLLHLHINDRDISNENGDDPAFNCGDQPAIPVDPTFHPVDSTASLTETTTEINPEITTERGEKQKISPPDPFTSETLIQEAGTNPQKPQPVEQPGEMTPADPELHAISTALAGITGLDPRLVSHAVRLDRVSRELMQAGYTPADIVRFMPYWRTHDFRWKKDRQLPTPEDVLEQIARSRISPREDFAASWAAAING
jgi:hypothetical protein